MTQSSTVSPFAQLQDWLRNLLRNQVSDWPVWWSGLTPFRRWFPAGVVGGLAIPFLLLKGFRADHLQIGFIVLLLSYSGRTTRKVMQFLVPLALTAVVYDSQRYYSDFIRGPIHITEPYYFDKNYFGIQTASGLLTPNEWWQVHTHAVLDIICGFYYLTFFAMFVAVAGYFRFWASRKDKIHLPGAEIARGANRMMWAFFALNVLGFSTYYWYAAAPPWYVEKYGLGPANMNAVATAAGALRFDAILGTHFFNELYGRSADVFGAIPSLHVAYPLLALLYAFRFRSARIFCALFYGIMCFSAVYLNHHYILDILWGSAYAIIIFAIAEIIESRRARSRAAVV